MTTEIPDFFIDEYFGSANPSFILVYISALRLCAKGDCNISRIADCLNAMEADVRRGLKFWEKAGLIKVYEGENGGLKIDFLKQEKNSSDFADFDESGELEEKPPAYALPTAIAASRPVYTSKEIDYYLEASLPLRKLFKSCENHMGKLLSYNDMCVLFSLHDWLRMPFELIELLVEYCCSNGRTSIRYIEKVAVVWADAGIDTTEKAKERIKLYNKDFRQIMGALGKKDREPIKSEADFMIKWLKTYKTPMEVVLNACEKTVLQCARPTFKYADSIIERWHKEGITSIEDIEKADEKFRQESSQKQTKQNVAEKPKSRKTRFSNFKERDTVDFSEIQQLEMERIEKELGL